MPYPAKAPNATERNAAANDVATMRSVLLFLGVTVVFVSTFLVLFGLMNPAFAGASVPLGSLLAALGVVLLFFRVPLQPIDGSEARAPAAEPAPLWSNQQ